MCALAARSREERGDILYWVPAIVGMALFAGSGAVTAWTWTSGRPNDA